MIGTVGKPWKDQISIDVGFSCILEEFQQCNRPTEVTVGQYKGDGKRSNIHEKLAAPLPPLQGQGLETVKTKER